MNIVLDLFNKGLKQFGDCAWRIMIHLKSRRMTVTVEETECIINNSDSSVPLPIANYHHTYPGRCFRLPEMGGSCWKESGNILDPTGKYRNNNRKMEAVFRSYVLGILPMTSSPFPAKNSLENGYKSSKHV